MTDRPCVGVHSSVSAWCCPGGVMRTGETATSVCVRCGGGRNGRLCGIRSRKRLGSRRFDLFFQDLRSMIDRCESSISVVVGSSIGTDCYPAIRNPSFSLSAYCVYSPVMEGLLEFFQKQDRHPDQLQFFLPVQLPHPGRDVSSSLSKVP